jgi:hypothetical protein
MDKKQIFIVSKSPKGLSRILEVSPEFIKENYSAVINVSDTPCATFDYQKEEIPSFWFPIHEVSSFWGYMPFIATLRVVNEYYKGDKPILLHCHAGANRSPSVAYAILKTKGYTDKEATESLNYPDVDKVFDRNIILNLIPPNLLEVMIQAEQHPTFGIDRLIMKVDNNYSERAEKIYDTITDFTLRGSNENPVHLVYDRTVKKFVIKKD